VALLEQSPAFAKLDGLESDMEGGRPELVVDVDREKAALYGLNTREVGATIRSAINGTEASTYRDGQDEYDITVRLAQRYREDLNTLGDLTVSGDLGQIPLSSVATWHVGKGPSDGYMFWTCYNSEREFIEGGKLEVTASQRDKDYILMVDWAAAQAAIDAGNFENRGGAQVIMPEDVSGIAWFIPMAHALEGLRASLLQGAGIGEVLHHFLWLLVFTGFLARSSDTSNELPGRLPAQIPILRGTKGPNSVGTYSTSGNSALL